MPRVIHAKQRIQAGRAWLHLLTVSLVVGAALICGCVTFFLGGVAAYPERWLVADIVPVAVVTLVLLAVPAVQGGITLQRICPGRGALGLVLRSMFKPWDASDCRMPTPGADELLVEVVNLERCEASGGGAAPGAVGRDAGDAVSFERAESGFTQHAGSAGWKFLSHDCVTQGHNVTAGCVYTSNHLHTYKGSAGSSSHILNLDTSASACR